MDRNYDRNVIEAMNHLIPQHHTEECYQDLNNIYEYMFCVKNPEVFRYCVKCWDQLVHSHQMISSDDALESTYTQNIKSTGLVTNPQ